MILIPLSVEILSQVWCHRPPIWPPTLALNVTYILTVPSNPLLGSPPYTNSLLSIMQISYPYSIAWVAYPGPRLCFIFCNKFIFSWWRFVTPPPLHSWRPFLHPQPEDWPYCGDRDPTCMGMLPSSIIYFKNIIRFWELLKPYYIQNMLIKSRYMYKAWNNANTDPLTLCLFVGENLSWIMRGVGISMSICKKTTTPIFLALSWYTVLLTANL
jgi:hypothetical protein